jgi:hypothetical protein
VKPADKLSAESEPAMKTHPYLRAYLAGTLVPTLVLPVLLAGFIVVRLLLNAPFPIERGLIFPMAVVPSLWGLWNALWIGTHLKTHISIGLQGAVLPLLLLPAGTAVAGCLGILGLGASGATWFQAIYVPYALIAPSFLAALVGYYLIWKYVVARVNRVLGIA